MADLQRAKQKAADADQAQGTGGLMTKKVNAAARSLMTRKVNPNQVWGVFGVVDRSGSMNNLYRDGTVQEVVQRLLGFAVIVDDDGTVPAIFFDHSIIEHEIKLDDFHDYVNRNRIRAGGSTGLTAALEAVARATGNGDLLGNGGGFMRRSAPKPSVRKMSTPAYVVIVTDGRPDDTRSAADLIRRLSYRGLFLKFLYVGNDRTGWQFLEGLDDDIPVGVPYERGGRLVDNVDAKNVGDIKVMSDEAFYDAMFDEVNTWLAAARQQGLI